MFEYKMPKMDHMTEECTIVEWLVKEGDKVKEGDIIMRIETAKTVLDVEANFNGTVKELIGQEGELLPVHTVIAMIEED